MTISTIPVRRKRRTILKIVGAGMIAIGGLTAAAAGGLIAVFGTTGTMDSGPHQISSSGAALVTDVADIQNTQSVDPVTGWPTVHVAAGGGDSAGLFIGIGPADAVQNYLAGVGVDQATDLNLRPFELAVDHHPGSAAARPPSGQSFWVASSSSRSTADFSWNVQNGSYRLVVMNADGNPNMTAQIRLQLILPHAFRVSLFVLAGSLLLAVTGVVVLVLGTSARSRTNPSFT